MRRKERAVNDRALIDEILLNNNICRIALCDGDMPYIIPMHYGYDRKKLYLHSAREGRKIDCIQQNRNVCFEVTHKADVIAHDKACGYTTYYTSVIGSGNVAFADTSQERLYGLQMIMRQVTGRAAWEFSEAEVARVAVLVITIESLSGKQSG